MLKKIRVMDRHLYIQQAGMGAHLGSMAGCARSAPVAAAAVQRTGWYVSSNQELGGHAGGARRYSYLDWMGASMATRSRSVRLYHRDPHR